MLAGKNNEEKIWNYLKSAGLNDFGTARSDGKPVCGERPYPEQRGEPIRKETWRDRRKLYGGGGQRQVSVLRNG